MSAVVYAGAGEEAGTRHCRERLGLLGEGHGRERDQCWGMRFTAARGCVFPFIPFKTAGLNRRKDKLAKTLGRKVKRENIRRINTKAIPALDCGCDTDGRHSLQPAVR